VTRALASYETPRVTPVMTVKQSMPACPGMPIRGRTVNPNNKVQVNNKVINFRITSVKPYKTNEKEEIPEGNTLSDSIVLEQPTIIQNTVTQDVSRTTLYDVQMPAQIPAQMPAQIPTQIPTQMPVQIPTGQIPEVQMPTFIPPTFIEPGSRNPLILSVSRSRFAVEIPVLRINPNEYAIHPVEAMLQEVTMVSADSFCISVFLTEKEKRDQAWQKYQKFWYRYLITKFSRKFRGR
jgi:hypothetical protein